MSRRWVLGVNGRFVDVDDGVDIDQLALLVEIIAASHVGVLTVTNDGVISWVYTPPEEPEGLTRSYSEDRG